MTQPTALYRHFDAAGRLLYVGISLGPIARLSQHIDASSWSAQIETVKVRWFPSRAEAHEAEREAIRSEDPVHNLMRYALKLETPEACEGDIEPVADLDAAQAERDAERARYELLRGTVSYRPIYSVDAASEAISISAADIIHWMVTGQCGYVVLRKFIRNYPTEGGTPHIYRKLGMTGWQLIDLIEVLHRQASTGQQILSERPQDAPKASLLREPVKAEVIS